VWFLVLGLLNIFFFNSQFFRHRKLAVNHAFLDKIVMYLLEINVFFLYKKSRISGLFLQYDAKSCDIYDNIINKFIAIFATVAKTVLQLLQNCCRQVAATCHFFVASSCGP